MATEKFDLDTATAIGSLIGEQADQLWTAAMALIVAEVFIGCRYFIDRESKFQWLWTGILWVGKGPPSASRLQILVASASV